MNIAGMILGTIAIIFAFIPIFGAIIAIPCLAVGLPLSAISFVKKKRQGQGIGMAIAGLSTCIIALIMVIAWIAIIVIGAVAN